MRPTPASELYIDGASRGNPGSASVGAAIKQPDGTVVETLSKTVGETTNNVAEYLALLYGLQLACRLGLKNLLVKTDSELLARQINGEYKVRDPQLRLLHDLARHLMEVFSSCRVVHIPREENTLADGLAAEAIKKHSRQSLFE